MLIKSKKKLRILSAGVAMALPLSLLGGMPFLPSSKAEITKKNYIGDYSTVVSVQNGSFNDISGPDMSGNSLSGWTAIDTSSKAQGMIINVGNERFSSQQSTYALSTSPGSYGKDDNVLMINSRKSSSDKNVHAKKGYRSTDITLEANSYYRLSVAGMTSLDGSDAQNSAYASIYVTGLKDLEGKAIELGYKNINDASYKAYYFYIATGSSSQKITLDLYLGSQYRDSYGVAFFDEVQLERYAQNTFFNAAIDAGYTFEEDNLGLDAMVEQDTKAKFMIKKLQDNSAKIDMSDYNFDFEDNLENATTSLGDKWEVSAQSQGARAAILSVHKNSQPKYFQDLTGYEFVGNDLSFNTASKKENSQALVLYSNSEEGFVSVKSKDIPIKAHGLYKFTIKAKISGSNMVSGNFRVNFKENDNFYTLNDVNKNNYELMSGSLTSFTSNSDNKFLNDYTTLTYFVKGHDLYDTSINIIFELGNNETPAKGCVVVDNIEMEYTTSQEVTDASEKLELKAYSTTSELNSFFNSTISSETNLKYPLAAEGWERTQDTNNIKNLESGVLLVKDRETYKNMYEGEAFYSSYPGNPNGIDSLNNIYMMQNRVSSYQSITSKSQDLSANGYHRISFDYLTQSYSIDKKASLTVEILDSKDMVLYHRSDINAKTFSTFNVYVHTGSLSSENIKVRISFGEAASEEHDANLMTGCVYIDNFVISESTETAFSNAGESLDLTNDINFDPSNKVGYYLTDAPLYTFSNDSTVANSAVGGIVKGDENEFNIEKFNSNILVLATQSATKATLTSDKTYSLSEGNYYKISFELRTKFTADEEEIKKDKEHDCEYGVCVGFSNFTLAKGLKSNEEWTKYTIYVNAISASTPNLIFSLNSDCEETLGSAFLTNLAIESLSSSSEYDSASSSNNYEKTVFTSIPEANDNGNPDDNNPSNPDDTTPPSDTDNGANNGNSDSKWLYIPSIIFGVAILVAIAGFAFRKVKVKKIEKIRHESYDKNDINREAILNKAKAARDEDAEEIREELKAVIAQREELENEHKEEVKKARESANGKITKETEREFKAYASKISRLNEKEEILKEQLESTLSAEYLIAVEKRLAQEEEKHLRELEKSIDKKKKNSSTDEE